MVRKGGQGSEGRVAAFACTFRTTSLSSGLPRIYRTSWRPAMSTSPRKRRSQKAYVPAAALAKAVEFDNKMMRVTFRDGRILSVPLLWFPLLKKATPAQRERYEIGGGGISLHWPELDEDLSIAGLMAGVDSASV